MARDSSEEFRKVRIEELHQHLPALVAGSSEGTTDVPLVAPTQTSQSGTVSLSRTSALQQYTIDLTARARQGDIDPVLGRDGEIRQLIDILIRRRQNNPHSYWRGRGRKDRRGGGSRVRIAAGDVPPPSRQVALCALDLVLLPAGAGVRGEFEQRLKSLLTEIQFSPQPIILFVDEAHTLIGAGGQAGQEDAANLLRPRVSAR